MSEETGLIISHLSTLASEKRMYVTVRQVYKGGIIGGVSLFVGGLFLGPIGMIGGGILAGVLVETICKDFKPVGEILANMERGEKECLVEQMNQIWKNVGAADITFSVALATGGIALKEKLLAALIDFLKDEMNLTVEER